MHSVFSRLLRKFPESAHTLRRTQTLTTVGLFLAIQMVLSSYGTIQVNDSLKISLAHLALAPTAMLFGPVAAALQGAMSDILGFLLKPTGPYFPGFTISAALGGVIYGLFLFESDRKLWQIVLARAVIMVLVNIMLNTLLSYHALRPVSGGAASGARAKNAMQFPIDCLLLTAVCRTCRGFPCLLTFAEPLQTKAEGAGNSVSRRGLRTEPHRLHREAKLWFVREQSDT